MPNGKLMLNPFLVVFDVRRVHVRGKQAVATEIGFHLYVHVSHQIGQESSL